MSAPYFSYSDREIHDMLKSDALARIDPPGIIR
jgi:hypothetical protein